MGKQAKLRTQRRRVRQIDQALGKVDAAAPTCWTGSVDYPYLDEFFDGDDNADEFVFWSMNKKIKTALGVYPFPIVPAGIPLMGWESAAIEVLAIEDRCRLGWEVDDWQKALLALLKGVLSIAGKAEFPDSGIEQIRKAGEALNSLGGMNEMRNTLSIWVPRRLQRCVDVFWNGIGEWKA